MVLFIIIFIMACACCAFVQLYSKVIYGIFLSSQIILYYENNKIAIMKDEINKIHIKIFNYLLKPIKK